MNYLMFTHGLDTDHSLLKIVITSILIAGFTLLAIEWDLQQDSCAQIRENSNTFVDQFQTRFELIYKENSSDPFLKLVMFCKEPARTNDSTIFTQTYFSSADDMNHWRFYQHPYSMFVLGGMYRDYKLIDSAIYEHNWRRGDKDYLVVDMTLSVGEKIRSPYSEGGFILESKEMFLNQYMSFVFRSTSYNEKTMRFNYVHNLGFLWEELVLPDTTVRRELFKINGIPFEAYIQNHPEFKFFNN